LRIAGDPIVYINIQPYANEVAANLALLQSRVQTETYVNYWMRLAEKKLIFGNASLVLKAVITLLCGGFIGRVSNFGLKLHSFLTVPPTPIRHRQRKAKVAGARQ